MFQKDLGREEDQREYLKKRRIDGKYGKQDGLHRHNLPKTQKKKQLFDCFFLWNDIKNDTIHGYHFAIPAFVL